MPFVKRRITGCRKRFSTGFTLLEAIVSLAIFSMVSMSLISLINVGLRNYDDAENVIIEQRVMKNAIEGLISDARIDLKAGEYRSEGYEVRWTATPVEPSRRALFETGRPSLYQLVLHSVDLTLFDSKGEEVRKENVRITGYQRSRVFEPL